MSATLTVPSWFKTVFGAGRRAASKGAANESLNIKKRRSTRAIEDFVFSGFWPAEKAGVTADTKDTTFADVVVEEVCFDTLAGAVDTVAVEFVPLACLEGEKRKKAAPAASTVWFAAAPAAAPAVQAGFAFGAHVEKMRPSQKQAVASFKAFQPIPVPVQGHAAHKAARRAALTATRAIVARVAGMQRKAYSKKIISGKIPGSYKTLAASSGHSADSAAAYKMAVLLSDAPGLCVGPAGEELFAPRLLQVGSRRSAPKARISMFDVVEAKLQAAALPKPKAAAPAVAAAAARPQPAFFVARAAFD